VAHLYLLSVAGKRERMLTDGVNLAVVGSAVAAAVVLSAMVSWSVCMFVQKKDETVGWTLPIRPKPTAPYPDVRRAGGFLFLAGASNREPSTGTADSGYFVGVSQAADGTMVRML
jgi:hypothetical protein